jgi:hypothetical protein
MPPKISKAEIARRFAYFAPDADRARQHGIIRASLASVAEGLVVALPNCRETSLAITALEEAMFWANAALARPDAETA